MSDQSDDMKVYAVMRGPGLDTLWGSRESAERRQDHLNKTYPRGENFSVVTMGVEK